MERAHILSSVGKIHVEYIAEEMDSVFSVFRFYLPNTIPILLIMKLDVE